MTIFGWIGLLVWIVFGASIGIIAKKTLPNKENNDISFFIPILGGCFILSGIGMALFIVDLIGII